MITAAIRKASASIIAPPKRLKCSDWADEFAYLPADGNAESGKYRLSRMPHQAAMLDDPFEPGVVDCYHMLASQAGGKTLCQILRIEYIIHQLHESVIVVRDVKERALQWMRSKFMPTVEATPCMKGLIADPRKKNSNSTALARKYTGGTLLVIGAKSPGAFRGSSAGHIDQDEIDSYITTKEGDPCALADRAAITFTRGSKCKESTPTIKDFSRIDAGFQRSDKCYYFLPCPCCGEFQWLKTEQLKFSFTEEEHKRLSEDNYHPNNYTWDIGSFPVRDTKNAIYVCEHCHKGWTDTQRLSSYFSGHKSNPPVIVNGKELRADWRPTAPFNGIRGRTINTMYLSIGLKDGFKSYLHMIAEDFLEAKRGGPATFMAWVNMKKCEAYEDQSEKIDWKNIMDRAEDYGPELPAEVMMLIAGVDVHPDRVEIGVYGWGDQEEVWAIDYQVITGDFDMPMCQEMVAAYLFDSRWKHPVLGDLTIAGRFIDLGHQTKVKAVSHFTKKYKDRYCFGVFGRGSTLGSLYIRSEDRRFGVKRYILNVDAFKDLIASRLKNEDKGERYIHFPLEYCKGENGTKRKTPFGVKFYNMLCSEARIFRDGKWRWIKKTSATRNEALDTMVYAFAGWEILQPATWIAKKWKEVSDKIRNETPNSSREIVLAENKEVKIPELRQERQNFKQQTNKTSQKWSRGFSGRWS